jgi:hypothetical protein
MKLENEAELENTRKLLEELQEQITRAKSRPRTPENAESLQSLVRTANQLREEIVRYQSVKPRQAS